MLDASPDSIGPFVAKGGPKAVLLIHGFTSTPVEMKPIFDALVDAGHTVRAPLLVGHGTEPEALAHTRWADWLASARHAFDALALQADEVFIIGSSLGALLGLVLAHERGERCAGVVAMSTPLQLTLLSQSVLKISRHLPLADVFPFARKTKGPDVSDSAVAAALPSYDRVPLAAAQSLLEGQNEVLLRIDRLATPVVVMHGRHDHTAPVANARRLFQLLRTADRRLIIYPRSWHILPMDVEHERVVADCVSFINDPIAFTAAG